MSAEVQADIDLYESDVLKIEKVVGALNHSRLTKTSSVEGWRNEIEHRFSEIGFKVNIVLSQIEGTQVGDGPLVPTQGTKIHTLISVQERIDEIAVGDFDHDQMRHEVQHNLRGHTDQATKEKKTSISVSGLPANTTTTAAGLIVPKP